MAWLFLAGVASGATILCTHFVAMLAYRPGAETTYEPVLTGVSLFVAVTGCALALATGALVRRGGAVAGGLVFGLTVTAMHYTGMAAFTADALVSWSIPYVAGSVALAAVGGILTFRQAACDDLGWRRFLPALLMVLTIVSLHFTAMGALVIMPLAPLQGAATGEAAQGLMAVAVATVAFLILSIAMASQALEDQTRRQAGRRLNQLIEGSVDGMLVESRGLILIANAAFADLCGVQPETLVGGAVSRWIDDADDMTGGALVQSELKPAGNKPIPVESPCAANGSMTNSAS